MPYTVESARTLATTVKAALAASKIRLFKSSFTPNANSVLADFTANECDYAGYLAGGIAVAAFSGPFNDPNGGSDLVSPLAFFSWVAGGGNVTNLVGGYFHTLTGGEVMSYQTYPVPVPMAAAGDAIPQVVSYTFGQNPV